MRKTLFFYSILAPAIANAQLTAGEVPQGAITYSPGIDLSISTPFTQDSAEIELDCDDFFDLRAWLSRGAPEIDAPNVAALNFIDNDIEVCMDLQTGFAQRPKYYAFGEALDCSGNYSWQITDPITLGDFGGFIASGPQTIDSLYIAIRRGAETGWIQLSFDVTGNPDVGLQVHEILPFCQIPTSIDAIEQQGFMIHPNPTNGGPIRVQGLAPIRNIQVLDATGKILSEHTGTTRTIDAPAVPGIYFARVIGIDGSVVVLRFVVP